MTDLSEEIDRLIRANVQRRIDEAKQREQAKRRRRRELEAARQRGLALRRRDRERNAERRRQ